MSRERIFMGADWGQRPARFYWYDETTHDWRPADMPPPRYDPLYVRMWKSRPVEPGDFPYCVTPDGVIDLHPSQWSVR